MQVDLAPRWGVEPEVYRKVVEGMAENDPDEKIADRAAKILRYGVLRPDSRIRNSTNRVEDGDDS